MRSHLLLTINEFDDIAWNALAAAEKDINSNSSNRAGCVSIEHISTLPRTAHYVVKQIYLAISSPAHA